MEGEGGRSSSREIALNARRHKLYLLHPSFRTGHLTYFHKKIAVMVQS